MEYKGLYVHIPFCDSICSYCAFSKVLKNYSNVENYLHTLEDEIKFKNADKYTYDSIFIGGGTPTCLNIDNLEYLLQIISKFNRTPDCEYTIESNPENLTFEKCLLLKKYGINRVSIGVQSFDLEKLKFLNRTHNFEIVYNGVNNVKKVGIHNINMDFIYGCENDSIELLRKDIQKAIKFDVTHMSFYCLEVENGTVLYNKNCKVDDDFAASLYQKLLFELQRKNFYRYEISNFSKENKFCSKHNLKYWKFTNYIGIGLSACSFVDHCFVENTKNLTKYLNKNYIASENKLSLDEEKNVFLQQNLRLEKGFKLKTYRERFNSDFLEDYKDKIDIIKNSLVISRTEDVYIKSSMLYIMNNILVDLLH